ncbi:hypothetical protein [Brevibacillus reuszeri]|uniref:hypothetical protein n=1 Tax=Brevibacillus reuszeri TaxID=54915 RepID=UPI003D1DC72B
MQRETNPSGVNLQYILEDNETVNAYFTSRDGKTRFGQIHQQLRFYHFLIESEGIAYIVHYSDIGSIEYE